MHNKNDLWKRFWGRNFIKFDLVLMIWALRFKIKKVLRPAFVLLQHLFNLRTLVELGEIFLLRLRNVHAPDPISVFYFFLFTNEPKQTEALLFLTQQDGRMMYL